MKLPLLSEPPQPSLQKAVRSRARPSEPTALADAWALESALRRELGAGSPAGAEVRFDAGSRALYATDGSNYRQVPLGVVIPRTRAQLVAAVAVAREHGAPITLRGGGTSLAGQSCNVAVILDCSKYLNRVLELDPVRRLARVEPGLVLDDLQAAARPHGLLFAPDPSTHNHCTLGGMIGNNSCGTHSVMGGRTSDNVESLEVLLYDGTRMRVGQTSDRELAALQSGPGRPGEIYRQLVALRDRVAPLVRARYPQIPRRVSGFNLDELLPERGFHLARALTGTEGTCVTLLEATVRLLPAPKARALAVLGFQDIAAAGDAVPEVLACGPIACEGIDDRLIEDMKKVHLHERDARLLPRGRGWLLVELGGEDQWEADDRAERLLRALSHRTVDARLVEKPEDQKKLWKVRESGLGATAKVPGSPETWEGWEDAAVPPDRVGDYLRAFRALLDRFGYQCALYGHLGQGCIHTRIEFGLRTADGIARYRSFVEEAADLVVSMGGSLSGEHGDGQSRAELLPKMFGPELVAAFAEFKAIWDPDGKMNPGKVVRPHRLDQDLRLGPGYAPPEPHHHFAYAEDGGSFAQATLRCVGVGECRKHEGGMMCPSYRATREERHSTRGRAHLLFEMLQGSPLDGGWREEAVKDALALCLSCKACKSECPVNVDMATYKAEFLAHYHRHRRRPRSAWSMGLIPFWVRLGKLWPEAVNLIIHVRGLSAAAKWLGGIAQERELPSLSPYSFREWFESREAGNPQGPRVLLWPDTFTDAFEPGVGEAAVLALEDAGFHVELPAAGVCCGRPLYDYGFLPAARKLLRRTLAALAPALRAGVPVVGLEPSCLSVFRDEATNLLPHDPDAQLLKEQAVDLATFLQTRAPGWRPPALGGGATVLGHCHHRAVLGFDAEPALLARMGVGAEVIDTTCCGMAGAFGYEADHCDTSKQIAELGVLPAVRNSHPQRPLIADGFSCRSQLRQLAGREPQHLAQLIAEGIGRRDQRRAPSPAALPRAARMRRHALALGLGLSLTAGAALLLRRRAR